jgi:cytidylate kinase
MVITIDGPSASGKGTAAKALAARLGFDYLDTGAMYRAVAWAACQRGISCSDTEAIRTILPQLHLEFTSQGILLEGEDITSHLRTPEVAQGASLVAVIPEVRRWLVNLQRHYARGRHLVTEGRDQGTVVFPDANLKFYLTADLSARAHRRWLEMQQRGVSTDYQTVLSELQARDTRDSTRTDSPLQQPPDAILIDSTHLTPQEVVDLMELHARQRLPIPPSPQPS